jgi:hypothetical protein
MAFRSRSFVRAAVEFGKRPSGFDKRRKLAPKARRDAKAAAC